MASYVYVLTQMDGTAIGDIPDAQERALSLPNNSVPSASFKVPMSHRFALNLLNDDCLLKVYRHEVEGDVGTIVFHGPIVGVEEVADGTNRSIQVTAAGALWRLLRRLIPSSLTENGVSYSNPAGTPPTFIWSTILNEVNTAAFTGVDQPL